jgi:ribosomal protein L44E
MANRRLTETELADLANPLIAMVRTRLSELSSGDASLLWALRRKLAKELFYDERGKPMFRKVLKASKRGEQQNKCAVCELELPVKNAVLDRFEAMRGYTLENTPLICPECDTRIQSERGYT